MREQPAICANLVKRGPRSALTVPGFVAFHQCEAQEASVARINDAEAVLSGLDLQVRPSLAVHQHGVNEEFGNPGWVCPALGGWVEQRAVCVKHRVMNH